MNFLHITDGDKKFIPSYIEFIKCYFDEENHEFIVYSRFKERSLQETQFIRLNRVQSFLEVRKKIKNANMVILHGLLDFHLVSNLFFMPQKTKFLWLIWGGDLYSYLHRYKSLKNFLRHFLRRMFIKKIGKVGSYLKGEVSIARKFFGFNGKWEKCLLYTSNSNDEFFRIKKVKFKSNIDRILVGNSGYATNNHLEIFQKLFTFHNSRNFKVICPLSYGNHKYIEKVKASGYKYFGNQFVAKDKFIPYIDYLNFLNEIDIAIFDFSRQLGIGNIIPLLCLGKTVYMRHDIEPAQTLLRIGFKIGDSTANITSRLPSSDLEQNIMLSRQEFSSANLILSYTSIGFY